MRGLSVFTAGLIVLLGAASEVTATDPNLCSPANPSFCLNGVSGTVTSYDALRVRINRAERTEAEGDKKERKASLRPPRVAASGSTTGIIAPSSGWGLWASGSRARFEGRVPIAPYDADLDTVTLGVDRLLGGRFLLGTALTHEQLDTQTRYNFGTQGGTGNTLTLYGSVLLNDTFSVDLTAGKGRLDTSQTRLDPTSAPGVPLMLRSNYDADRTLWSLALNAYRQFGAFGIGGRVGYLDARERQDGYLEFGGPSARRVNDRTVLLRQAFIGIDASYGFARNWEVHGSGVYRRDTSRDDGRSGGGLPGAVGVVQPADRDEREFVVGLRFYGWRNFRLNVEFLKTAGRDQFANESLTFTGRFDF